MAWWEQRRARVVRRASHAQTQRLARDLIVPDGFAVRMQQHVRVCLDQTRHQRQARKLDYFRVARRPDACYWSNRFNLLAPHEDGPVVVKLCGFAIKHARRFQQVNRFRRGCRTLCLNRPKQRETDE